VASALQAVSLPYPVTARPDNSRPERVSDAAVHWAGLFAVTGAVPALIVMALIPRGDVAAVTGAAIQGATLVLMILCPALHNSPGPPGLGRLWRQPDSSAIALGVAGTQEPFARITGQGTGPVIGLWGAAVAGVAFSLWEGLRFHNTI
jgi:hemolysin III